MTQESDTMVEVAVAQVREEPQALPFDPTVEAIRQRREMSEQHRVYEPNAREVAEFGEANGNIDPWRLRGFQDAMKGANEPPPWVIQDLLMEQSATLVSAHPHSMKSLSWLQACLEAVTHQQVWGHFAAPKVKSALFIETEDPTWLVETRIRGVAKGLGIDPESPVPGFHYLCIGPFNLQGEESRLKQLIEQEELNLIVLSTLQSLLMDKDWSRQQDMQPIMAMMVRLARVCPTVLLTHSPWDKSQRRAAGTITQAANFLTAVHFAKVNGTKSGEQFVTAYVDSKAGAEESRFTLELVTDANESGPGSVRKLIYRAKGLPTGAKKDLVVAALTDNPEATSQEIASQTGVGRRHVQKIRKDLRAAKG